MYALLEGVIDYAGLFPPASLSMAEAVECYDAYRRSADAWALGRFVLPAAGLEEFARFATSTTDRDGSASPWALSVLVGPHLETDAASIAEHSVRHGRIWPIESLEAKATSSAEIRRLAALPNDCERFVELPAEQLVGDLIDAVRDIGGSAKIRTGGITAEAFPVPDHVLRFLRACRSSGVPFKATAGLHHPVRSEYPATYRADAPRVTMYGFLNVMIAALFVCTGDPERAAQEVLLERDSSQFRFDDAGVTWRRHLVPLADVSRARAEFIRGIGSCSFREPLDDLVGLELR